MTSKTNTEVSSVLNVTKEMELYNKDWGGND